MPSSHPTNNETLGQYLKVKKSSIEKVNCLIHEYSDCYYYTILLRIFLRFLNVSTRVMLIIIYHRYRFDESKLIVFNNAHHI